MSDRIPGLTGLDVESSDGRMEVVTQPGAGFALPSPIGSFPAVPMDGGATVARIITNVTRDWSPPTPRATPEIVVHGRSLTEVFDALNRLREWGEGGGMLRTDAVPSGTSPTVTVVAHANLVLRIPRWAEYGSASTAARAEWDQMVAKLRIHEERHMAIAVEEADNLAAALMGREISEIPTLVTDANRTLRQRQDQMDADTNHGANPGVAYGDVILDTSIP